MQKSSVVSEHWRAIRTLVKLLAVSLQDSGELSEQWRDVMTVN